MHLSGVPSTWEAKEDFYAAILKQEASKIMAFVSDQYGPASLNLLTRPAALVSVVAACRGGCLQEAVFAFLRRSLERLEPNQGPLQEEIFHHGIAEVARLEPSGLAERLAAYPASSAASLNSFLFADKAWDGRPRRGQGRAAWLGELADALCPESSTPALPSFGIGIPFPASLRAFWNGDRHRCRRQSARRQRLQATLRKVLHLSRLAPPDAHLLRAVLAGRDVLDLAIETGQPLLRVERRASRLLREAARQPHKAPPRRRDTP